MSVLVTGSSGFIGRAVTAAIEASGDTVIAFDRPDDIRDGAALLKAAENATGIINLAGRLGTPELFGHEAEAATVNILGALNVYDAAKCLGIPVVQIGTGHKGQPNPYAITKGCAEDLGLARANWQGEKIAVVRAYHVYGPFQAVGPPHGTASVHKFFPTFTCRALTGMSLELCGDGGQLIDPVYVDDVAEVLVNALHGPYGAVTEAGNGIPFSVEEVATNIAVIAAGRQRAFRIDGAAQRDGEPLNAKVIAAKPACANPWPYKVAETVDWYAKWLG